MIRERYLRYLTALLIAVAGLGFFAFATYYIAYLPVPTAMQPLRVRILTALQLEDILEREVVFEEEKEVYLEPSFDAEIISGTDPDRVYRRTEEKEEWLKIRVGEEEGWVPIDDEEEEDL